MAIARGARTKSRRESTDLLSEGRRIRLRSSSLIQLKADLPLLGTSCD
jgi:hypothetical protein